MIKNSLSFVCVIDLNSIQTIHPLIACTQGRALPPSCCCCAPGTYCIITEEGKLQTILCNVTSFFFFFLMWLHFVVVKEICLYKHQEIIFSTHELLIIPGKRILEKGFGMYVGELWHPIRLVWSYLNITVIRWDHCFSNEGHLFQTKSHVGPHFLNINAELLLLEVMCTGDNGLQLP